MRIIRIVREKALESEGNPAKRLTTNNTNGQDAQGKAYTVGFLLHNVRSLTSCERSSGGG